LKYPLFEKISLAFLFFIFSIKLFVVISDCTERKRLYEQKKTGACASVFYN